jgi:hypothetical protein
MGFPQLCTLRVNLDDLYPVFEHYNTAQDSDDIKTYFKRAEAHVGTSITKELGSRRPLTPDEGGKQKEKSINNKY